ncbi:MAG: hypothetical protein HN736_11285 [Anaerolineae bacterium]|jgi:hypothetical protein|nr:hypothetical protein [Anaerolineae bacterium]MBT4312437.1 hypothetical protein [Anaerolineae bacterium]MBT4842294.1 hypothetical protein [Anaerolineae bacterium]MBT6062827.1 hypothetical protein [Anaerolineae bacterium]MBT6322189.1 hypothetical protein [Anaerolineae bacterium]
MSNWVNKKGTIILWEKIMLRFRSSKVVLYWLYISAIFLILIVAVTSYYLNIPISHFTRDPLAITGGHPFLGFISNIGVILWSFSVAICFFSYVLLKTSKKPHDVLRYIMFGGFISLVLLLDDLFMLHENIYPKYFGVSEKITFILYGVLVLFYLVKFRKIIIETDFIFLLLALFFSMLSILVDLLPDSLLLWHHLYEDGSKFFGVVSWFGYQFLACFQEVQSVDYIIQKKEKM